MEKTDLLIIEKTYFEIAHLLASDEKIQRLLMIDSKDALTGDFIPVSVNEVLSDEYISLAPHLENGIVKPDRNMFIIIEVDEFLFNDFDADAKIIIYIGTDKEHILLENNHHRLLQLINRIYTLIQNKKFSCTGLADISSVTAIEFSEYTFGYRIPVSFNEQLVSQKQIRKAEI